MNDPEMTKRACECGAAIHLHGGYSDASIMRHWEQSHSGRGHGPCTLAEARDIRWAGRPKVKVEP